VIGAGNFIVARRSKRAWPPSEKAPLRHIPNNAILGAPLGQGSGSAGCEALLHCTRFVGMHSRLPRILVLWVVRWSVAGCIFPGRSERPSARLGDHGRGRC